MVYPYVLRRSQWLWVAAQVRSVSIYSTRQISTPCLRLILPAIGAEADIAVPDDRVE
jgi:hypothetical protein